MRERIRKEGGIAVEVNKGGGKKGRVERGTEEVKGEKRSEGKK